MSAVEWAAAALGLINVSLIIRRSVWNYPFGILMVTLYCFVFLEAKLYSDGLLQIFFLLIQVYGWREWLLARRPNARAVSVGRLSIPARLWWLAATVAASIVWGLAMMRFTNAAAPMIDAAIAGTSVSAQVLLSLRRVESWVLWIVVDTAAIGLFYSRGLYPTCALYVVFLVMAVAGLVSWACALGEAG